MTRKNWCEHLDKVSKYTVLKHYAADREVLLKVQTWICPECGSHGAETEVVQPDAAAKQ